MVRGSIVRGKKGNGKKVGKLKHAAVKKCPTNIGDLGHTSEVSLRQF